MFRLWVRFVPRAVFEGVCMGGRVSVTTDKGFEFQHWTVTLFTDGGLMMMTGRVPTGGWGFRTVLSGFDNTDVGMLVQQLRGELPKNDPLNMGLPKRWRWWLVSTRDRGVPTR